MHKLVLDLEMCDKVKREFRPQVGKMCEIIQIGAVLLDDNNNEIIRFETYVKPRYSVIRQVITDLTHIEEKHVIGAPDIEEAMQRLCNIIIDNDNTILCTWSDSDVNVISKELEIKNIHNEIISKLCENYFDIQKDFNEKVNIQNRINLTKALNMVGIDFEGKEHGALADAVNTAKLYKEMQDNENIQNIIANIEELMTEKECTTTLGSMFDFSQFNIGG